jgi:hypothetical protein
MHLQERFTLRRLLDKCQITAAAAAAAAAATGFGGLGVKTSAEAGQAMVALQP